MRESRRAAASSDRDSRRYRRRRRPERTPAGEGQPRRRAAAPAGRPAAARLSERRSDSGTRARSPLKPERRRPQEARKPTRGPVSPVAPRRSVVAATCRRRIRASRTTNYLSGVSCGHPSTPGGSSLQALGCRFGAAGACSQRRPQLPSGAIENCRAPPSATPLVCRRLQRGLPKRFHRLREITKYLQIIINELVDRSGVEPLTSATS